jgi:NADPH:quinone reductase
VTEFGGPDALEVVELPEPSPGPGQLLIRVHAATVNPTDTYIPSGALAESLRRYPPPYVPGMDAAGVLEAIGPDVTTDLTLGARVMAIVVPAGSSGAYAEKVVVPADSVVRVPVAASDAEAATLPMNGLTAQLTLDRLGLAAGQTIAVTGAAGCYGGYLVQLAKLAGLRVVADASEADEPLVRSLGADVVVRRGDDVAARIRRVVPAGVDAVADGSVQHELLFGALRDGGQFATVRRYQGENERGISVVTIQVREYAREQAKLDRLRELAEAGALTLRVARTMPAAEAPQAHRLLAEGGIRGRLVLTF